MQKTQDETELLEALRSSDRVAFAHLVEAYENQVYNLALKLLHDEDEAEDVLQETFLSAYRGLATFEGRSKLSTWIYRIATNASLMRLRKHKYQAATISLDEPIDLGDWQPIPRELVDWSGVPDEVLLSEEARQMMDEAIADLPETLHVVFVLRDIEDLSAADTGEILDLSIPAVKSRLHRARLMLRERLASYYSERIVKRVSDG